MNYYISVLKKYATFGGRARRKEFWMFVLFNFIFAMVAVVLDNVLGLTVHFPGSIIDYGYIYYAYALFTMIPNLAVTVRRLHDVGKSGWMFFIVLIPIAGGIWLLVLLCKDSEPGINKYGPNPKQLFGNDPDSEIF